MNLQIDIANIGREARKISIISSILSFNVHNGDEGGRDLVR